MFASMLQPTAPSSKYANQATTNKNNYPTQPNPYSMRVFKGPTTAQYSYPSNSNYESGYAPLNPSEYPGANWYPTSAVPIAYSRPQTHSNYSIYPNPANETYIYERSTCSKSDIFSGSEYDMSPSSGFSPALSSDSTLASPDITNRPLEDQSVSRSATPAVQSYPSMQGISPQSAAMIRQPNDYHLSQGPSVGAIRVPVSLSSVGSNGPIPVTGPGGFNGYVPEYAESSISEIEVNERDRVAKVNAGYNSVSTGSLYSTANSTDGNTHRNSTSPSHSNSSSQRFNNTITAGQPNHPDLQFLTKPQDSDRRQSKFQPYSSVTTAPAYSYHDSPPQVERLSSEAQENYPPQNISYPTSYPSQSPQDSQRKREPANNIDHTRGSYRSTPSDIVTHPPSISSFPSVQATYATSTQEPGVSTHPPHLSSSIDPSHPRTNVDRRGAIPVATSQTSEGSSRSGSENVDHRQTYNLPASQRQDDVLPDKIPGLSRRDTRRSAIDPSNRLSIYASSPPRDPIVPPQGVDQRKESRTSSVVDQTDHRPTPPSRQGSFISTSVKSTAEPRRTQIYTQDPNDVQNMVLSASPTQIKASPTEPSINSSRTTTFPAQQPAAPHSHPISLPVDNDKPYDRTRRTSISFSAGSRPVLPDISQRGPVYTSYAGSDESTSQYGNRSVEHDKNSQKPRSRDLENMSYSRTDTKGNNPNSVPYYAQTTSSTSSRESDRQSKNPSRPYIPLPTPPTHIAPPVTDPSRSRTPHPLPQHTEPVRRQSDGEKPRNTAPVQIPTHNSHQNRSPVTPDKAGSPHASEGSVSSSSTASYPTIPLFPEPQRRYSDGDQTMPSMTNPGPSGSGRNSAPLARSVRWNDNLICPSPIMPSQRRKGWYNRRGDHLWTNDGIYKPPAPGQEYPPDLAEYPDHGEGWQNEEGTRIDMGHRLVPKTPLRSALKQTKPITPL